jgi:oligopeptide/dipeptide ABC transporter ATP-binding protein
VCERVLVMYLGRIVEEGPAAAVFAKPLHPYTEALRAAVPDPDDRPGNIAVVGLADGETPSACLKPDGCVFHTRCSKAGAICREQAPALREISAGRRAACHFPG